MSPPSTADPASSPSKRPSKNSTGSSDSDVDLDTKQVTVAYDPDTVEIASITAAIGEAGYTVEL